jgi:hypothetical protein
MDLGRFILANSQPPEVVQPRQRPLHVPAIRSQPAPMRRPPSRDVRTDAAPAQLPAMRVRVVASVAIQAGRPATWAPRLAAHRWNRIHQRDHRIDVGDVGGRRVRHERNPARIGDDLVLAPPLAGGRQGSGPSVHHRGRARSCCRSAPAPNRSCPPRAARPAASRGASAKPRLGSSRGASSSRSYRNRSPSPEAGPPS